MLCQLLLQVSVKLERVLLGDHYADLLVLCAKVAQYALCHALKTTLDESIRHDNTVDEGLKSAGNIKVTHLENQVAPCEVQRGKTTSPTIL